VAELTPYVLIVLVVLVWLRAERLSAQITRLHEELAQLRRDLGVAPPLSPQPSARVRALALDTQTRTEAIRAYREESGADVRHAVRVVEQLTEAGRVG
jgi:hypothetical protein